MTDDPGLLRRRPTRRRVLGTAGLLPLTALVPKVRPARSGAATGPTYRFFTDHEAAVVDAATRRIAPGPEDDVLEIGHPGAHECDVVGYIDTMLSMFEFSTPKIFAGGPWSNRHTKGPDYMQRFVKPDRAQAQAWRTRIRALQRTYRDGIKALDAHASGDFTKAAPLQQDLILAKQAVLPFTNVMFGHTIEGMYSVPEYGGNKGLAGWREIDYPGDSQPRGYTAKEMAQVDVDVIDPTGIVSQLLGDFENIVKIYASGLWRA
ncbi:MAG TPA: gluconate 2-dehydrogenase subunit 3 family protein [Mycobacteriales bacterium]|nr:gluconate 2-dehydrogenase subunit 3 family protein [Mycobacteriales bacterium]